MPPNKPTKLAVFNFQMKTETPDWLWLEKLLSDQLTTDFATSPKLAVVARDEMQVLASQMNWVPEMAQDAGQMGQIGGKLEIAYLVSGVYSVHSEQIEIIGQIVEIKTRNELFRKTVSGKVADVLDLQKKLSGELLGWLVKKPAAEVQATLPVWTKVLPAAKALYEGMDLYDHGRYAEAWLKFRSASRTDPDYLEALYWVGKMYYFMDRYEHARRALERFVYMDSTHPRIGDAIKEYLDTYENLDTAPETLLAIYSDFAKRWPEASVHDPDLAYVRDRHPEAYRNLLSDLLALRSARLLQAMGRYGEAAKLSGPAYRVQANRAEMVSTLAAENLGAEAALTGSLPPREVLANAVGQGANEDFMVQFGPGEAERISKPMGSGLISGEEASKLARTSGTVYDAQNLHLSGPAGPMPRRQWNCLLLAPSGQTFKSLRLYPLSDGQDATLKVEVRMIESLRLALAASGPTPFAQAARDGVAIDNLPPVNVLELGVWVEARDLAQTSIVKVTGLKVRATFVPVPPQHGALMVRCASTPEFKVSLDGHPGRAREGLIGPLTAGRHLLRFEPASPDSPFDTWDTEVQIVGGRTVEVVGQLPWKKGTPWSGWEARLIVPAYPGQELTLRPSLKTAPQLLFEEDRVRLVWSHRRDIWTASSTDGVNFSAPRRLNLPISSAWSEDDVRCFRDETGRYVLSLDSDRDSQHVNLRYLAWSRDFEHWTAPARATCMGAWTSGALAGPAGDLLMFGRKVSINNPDHGWISAFYLFRSTDGFDWRYQRAEQRWAPLDPALRLGWQNQPAMAMFTLSPGPRMVEEVHCWRNKDAGFTMMGGCGALKELPVPGQFKIGDDLCCWFHAATPDLVHWTLKEFKARLPGGCQQLCATSDGQQEVALILQSNGGLDNAAIFLWCDPHGDWMFSPRYPGVASSQATLAYDAKWGYYIVYMPPDVADRSIKMVSGPYLLHGKSLAPLLKDSRPAAPLLLEGSGLSLGPVTKVLLPPDAKLAATQPDPPPFKGADSPQQLLQLVDRALVENSNEAFRLLGEMRQPDAVETERDLAKQTDDIWRRAKAIAAISRVNYGSNREAVWNSTLGRWGIFRRVSPLANAVSGQGVNWPAIGLRVDGDRAWAAGDLWSMVRVGGKWYLVSQYANPPAKALRQRQLAFLRAEVDGLYQRILDRKVGPSEFDAETDRLDQRYNQLK